MKYLSKYWVCNIILIVIIAILSNLSFTTYVAYIIKEIALQDVYYNFKLYLKTYHFLLLSLFSLGFFLLPFLYIITDSFGYKKIIIFCFTLQILSLLILLKFMSFFTMFASVITMSLSNATFILLRVNIWNTAKKKYKYYFISTTICLDITILVTAFQITYNISGNDNVLILISNSIICLLISLILTSIIHIRKSKKKLFKNFSDHLFINIFHIMRNSNKFIKNILVVLAATLLIIFLENIKLNDIKYYFGYYNLKSLIYYLIVSFILANIVFLFATIIRYRMIIAIILLTLLTITTITVFIINLNDIHSITNYQKLIILSDKITSFVFYCFIIGYIIHNFLKIFKKNQIFSFSIFYIILAIFSWITLQITDVFY